MHFHSHCLLPSMNQDLTKDKSAPCTITFKFFFLKGKSFLAHGGHPDVWHKTQRCYAFYKDLNCNG